MSTLILQLKAIVMYILKPMHTPISDKFIPYSNRNRISYILVFVVIIITLTACNTNRSTKKEAITVSILAQKFIVEQLIKDSIDIEVMVTKGNSPATYEPTPKQMQKINQSSLYLKIGHIGFEKAWLNRFAEQNPDLKFYDTSKGINLIKGEDTVHGDHIHEGGIDPHIWTSPKTMKKVVINTANALINHFPNKENTITQNSSQLIEEIDQLDSLYESKLKNFKHRKFLIFHPAYTYLANDYHLEQISIELYGKEPSVKWIKEIITTAKTDSINAIFVQQEFDKRNAELISKELNIPIINVNPLSEDWIKESHNLLNNLITSFN